MSGGATTLLRRTRLKAEAGGGFALVLSGESLALMGDVVDRRVASLSSAIGAPITIASQPARLAAGAGING